MIKNDDPIRVYHHPREVSVHPKSNIIQTYNSDGSLLDTFKLVNKEVTWIEDVDNDQSEIVITLNVEKP